MKTKLAVLKSEILKDIERIDRLFEKFSRSWEKFQTQGEYAYLVESAFHTNQLYTGFERIFRNIAVSFENSLDDKSWHRSLLDRMILAIEDIRPAVIQESNFKCLDELRAFRHFFRHSYDLDFDKGKFSIVAKWTLELKNNYKQDIDKFLQFIDRLSG